MNSKCKYVGPCGTKDLIDWLCYNLCAPSCGWHKLFFGTREIWTFDKHDVNGVPYL